MPEERHGRGLLWRVGKAGAVSGYLFGTIHLGDAAVVNLPGAVTDALDHSRRFVMEVRLDAEEMASGSASLLYDDPEALRTALGNPLFERAMSLLARYGLPEMVGAQLRPWALYLTLSTPSDTGGIPLDLILAERAKAAGKSVTGLETVSEQAGSLASLPAEDQVGLVQDAVCHYETLQSDIQMTKQRYLDRDLAALAGMVHRYDISEAPRYRHLLQQVLWDRNRRMVDRMEPLLAEGGVFVAVGALHLPGPGGLLRLLEERGYAVEAVY
jgi:uncharacterized protein YbaP (TraB family)